MKFKLHFQSQIIEAEDIEEANSIVECGTYEGPYVDSIEEIKR